MSNWIRCDERMPTDDVEVLVYYGSIGIGGLVYLGDGARYWSIEGTAADEDEVTHWQPLPEPPND